MTNFPWLTVAGAIPLVGTVAVCLTPGRSAPGTEADRRSRDLLVKRIALVFTLITLGVTAAMAANFTPGGRRFQFTEVYQWIPQFGVHYAVGVDGIALVLIGLTAVLMPVVVLGSWNDADGSPRPGPGSSAGQASGAPAGGEPSSAEQAGAGSRPRRSVKTYFALLLLLETM